MKSIIFLSLFLLLIGFVSAQDNSEVVATDIDYSILEFQDVFMKNNQGSLNESDILLTLQNQNSNYVFAKQEGEGNLTSISQEGRGHFTELIQVQNNNKANIWSLGKFSVTSVIQDGEGNLLNSYIDNNKNQLKSVLARQYGNENEISVALLNDGSTMRAAELIQLGNKNTINLVSDYEWDYPGISVKQQSGSNGQGMTVNLYQSAFSFPMVSYP